MVSLFEAAALSVGDRVRTGRYQVQARFERSVLLFHSTGRPLFVVRPEIGDGPLNVVLPHPEQFGEELLIPRKTTVRRYMSAMPEPEDIPQTKLLHFLATPLEEGAPPDSLISLYRPCMQPSSPAQKNRDRLFFQACAHFAREEWCSGATLVRGSGSGLTPSGDDFLCGLLLAMRIHRKWGIQRLHYASKGGNAISNAFLDMAAQGRVHRGLQLFLRQPSIGGLRDILAFGHTSGADLLCGLRWGLERWRNVPGRRSSG
jgi:hypothetical protein